MGMGFSSGHSTRWLFLSIVSKWNCWFLWRQENREIRGKPSEQGREPTTNSTHMQHHAGTEIEHRPLEWEACALTTAPSPWIDISYFKQNTIEKQSKGFCHKPVSLYKNLYFSFRFPGKCRCLPAYVLAVLLPSLRDIKNRSKLQHHCLPRLEILGFTQPFSCQVKV